MWDHVHQSYSHWDLPCRFPHSTWFTPLCNLATPGLAELPCSEEWTNTLPDLRSSANNDCDDLWSVLSGHRDIWNVSSWVSCHWTRWTFVNRGLQEKSERLPCLSCLRSLFQRDDSRPEGLWPGGTDLTGVSTVRLLCLQIPQRS